MPRNRYRADSLLNFLKTVKGDAYTIIGITEKDISCSKNGNNDWGVMGLGTIGKGACVISTFRLNKHSFNEQLDKDAIHEIGHNMGLDHCRDATCILADAKGKNGFDNRPSLCLKCRKQLHLN